MDCSLQLWVLRTSARWLFRWVQTLLLRAACHLFLKKDLSEVWYLHTLSPAPVCFLEALHFLNGNSQVASGTCPFSIYNFSSVKACSPCSVRKTRHHWKHQAMFIPRRVRFAFNFKSIVQHTTVIWKSTIGASLKYKIRWSTRSLIFLKYLSASLDPAENPFLSAVPWCKDCSCGHGLIIQIWLKTQCCAEILIEKKWDAFWS